MSIEAEAFEEIEAGSEQGGFSQSQELLRSIESVQVQSTPDIKSMLESAIASSDSEVLRKALWAENIGEMNPELSEVLDTILGIKLLAIERNDDELLHNAEQHYLAALDGDPAALELTQQALQLARAHDAQVHQQRIADRQKFLLQDGGWTPDMIMEEAEQPERLGYGDLSVVHATDHEPVRSQVDGHMHIDDRYSADGRPRSTVHVALNHMVESSAFSSNWDDKRVIVVAPMDKTVAMNGEPTSMSGHDTWWEAAPNRGVVLPEETIIVKPGASRPIQEFPDQGEVRYKNAGITQEDVDGLITAASDYELSVIAKSLGITLSLSFNHRSRGTLGETGLRQYKTEITPEQRQDIHRALSELLANDPEQGERRSANLAKRIAVRRALEIQGREVIEPNTIMDASFMSEELDAELLTLSIHKGMTGHHSESTAGRLEKKVLSVIDKDGNIPETDRPRLIEEVKSSRGDLSKNTLLMYYRLGLI